MVHPYARITAGSSPVGEREVDYRCFQKEKTGEL
jgi:hypothetical protein